MAGTRKRRLFRPPASAVCLLLASTANAFQQSPLLHSFRNVASSDHAFSLLPLRTTSKSSDPSSLPSDDASSTATTATSRSSGSNSISIVYCTGCRWMLRSTYYAQELLATFDPDELSSVTLIPSRPPLPGGMLFVTLNDQIVVWDRKEQGRFPETKELKQMVRDTISPDRDLGHSDVSSSDSNDNVAPPKEGKCEECPDDNDNDTTASSATSTAMPQYGDCTDYILPKSPHVTIKYCAGCKWLLRAAWDAQELLTTFADEINAVTLMPTIDPAGQFTVLLDDEIIWDRKTEGRHAEPKELKQRIRDVIDPERNLGHSDVKRNSNEAEGQSEEEDVVALEDMDDDEAEEMRNYFGVM